MKRAALIAGISILALLTAGPAEVRAWTGDIAGWSAERAAVPPAPVSQKAKPRARATETKTDKTPPIPAGLLHIIVSIDKQRATLFADGRPVASTAISSGTASHPTPMGVFSIIQKSRHHVSNLYGAAMPYMQRITWSGSALHQGPLPGYPASHGCVRLTENFAQLLWKTTKMGARVIVTRPEVAPIEFDHPRLFVPKPQMVESPPLPLPRPSAAAPTLAPVIAAAEPARASPVAWIRTADATHAMAVAVTSVSGDDAKAAVTSVVTELSASTSAAEQPTKVAATDGAGDAVKREAPAAEAAPDAENKSAEAEAAPTGVQSAEAAPAEAQVVQAAEAKAEAKAEVEPVEIEAAETKSEARTNAAPDQAKPIESQLVEAKPADPEPTKSPAAVEAKPIEAAPAVQPTEAVAVESKPATIAAPAPIIVDERPKDMPAAAVREANGRPISVFVSLKDGKLYVRQGWKALFDAPVSFERPEQPIGTHVYTAMGMKVSGEGLRWTVVSIPSSYRRVSELKSPPPVRKGRHEPTKAVEAEPPAPTPAAALDRVVLAPELVERIAELITPGSSLIVSDNKLSDETGEYTDFIVTTR